MYGSGQAGTEQQSTAAKEVDTQKRSMDQYISLLFRFLQLVASLIAFIVMLTVNQAGLTWRTYQAFRYLIAATVISAFWSLFMLLLELMQLLLGKKIRLLAHRMFVATMDFLLAYLTLSAGSAAAAITTFNDHNSVSGNYAPCATLGLSLFCSRTKVATAFALLTFFFLIPHTILSTLLVIMRAYEG